MHCQLCYSAKEREILAALGRFSSPKSLLLCAAAHLVLSCAPPSPRPDEILRPCVERGAPPAVPPLLDEGAPSALASLLHGARLEASAVDADAATVVAHLAPRRWEELDPAAQAAWLARVDRLSVAAGAPVALRFHFLRTDERWQLDLRAVLTPR